MPFASPEVQSALPLIRKTIQLLESAASGFATDLARHLRTIEHGTPFERKEAFVSIGALCHPRAMGEVFVPGATSKQWLDHVGALHDACAAAFDTLEAEFSTLTDEQRLERG
jgi:hypothetical protein